MPEPSPRGSCPGREPHYTAAMSLPTAAGAAPAAPDDTSRLSRTFVLIILTEALTIAALYWFGRHFA